MTQDEVQVTTSESQGEQKSAGGAVSPPVAPEEARGGEQMSRAKSHRVCHWCGQVMSAREMRKHEANCPKDPARVKKAKKLILDRLKALQEAVNKLPE
jgi:hypothetical protein